MIFRGVQDSVVTEKTYESESLVWFKNSGEGSTVTTLKLPSFTQTPYVTAPGGIQIDVGFEVDQSQVKEQIAISDEDLGKLALDLSKQPGFEYIADLDAQGAINWQAVALIQDHWDYEAEGLTAAGAALVALAVACVIGPGGLAGFGTGGLRGLTATAIGVEGGALYAGLTAGFTGLYTQTAITLVNNQGDIGATLDQLASSATIRSFATAAMTAGVLEQLDGVGRTITNGLSNQTGGVLANNQLAFNITNNLVQTTVNSAAIASMSALINQGDFSEVFEEKLLDAIASQGSAFASGRIGLSYGDHEGVDEGFIHKFLHAINGCISAEVGGSDCASGAIGAAAGEIAAERLGSLDISDEEILAYSNLIAGVFAAALGVDVQTAAQYSSIAVANNYLTTKQRRSMVNSLSLCVGSKECQEKVLEQYASISKAQDAKMKAACESQNYIACRSYLREAVNYAGDYEWLIALPVLGVNPDIEGDRLRSGQTVMDIVFDDKDAFNLLSDVQDREAFFGMMASQFPEANWFDGAQNVTSRCITGLGGDGCGSGFTFAMADFFTRSVDAEPWREEAGNTLMSAGYENFKQLYDGQVQNYREWSIDQLVNEQTVLQPIHERYLGQGSFLFTWVPRKVGTQINLNGLNQVDVLDLNDRIRYGCIMMDYNWNSETSTCR